MQRFLTRIGLMTLCLRNVDAVLVAHVLPSAPAVMRLSVARLCTDVQALPIQIRKVSRKIAAEESARAREEEVCRKRVRRVAEEVGDFAMSLGRRYAFMVRRYVQLGQNDKTPPFRRIGVLGMMGSAKFQRESRGSPDGACRFEDGTTGM